jgi:hypothetical protein
VVGRLRAFLEGGLAHLAYGLVLPLLIHGMRRDDGWRALRADHEARRIG